MKNSDIVDEQTIERVRAIMRRTALRTVLLSAFIGFGSGALLALLVCTMYGAEKVAGIWLVLVVFPATGLHQTVHWSRHYRCIFRQLDALSTRVANGELIYGAQVDFHSYR